MKNFKKLLALILCVVMLLSIATFTAFTNIDEGDDESGIVLSDDLILDDDSEELETMTENEYDDISFLFMVVVN